MTSALRQILGLGTITLLVVLTTGVEKGRATEAPGRELGKALFDSVAMSPAGKSCASCHPEGKGLEEIDAYDDGMLKEMINFCIRDALKGQMLPEDSQELESLLLYLRSLKK